jgi:N-acetylmuramoyl-L-alanine amidase
MAPVLASILWLAGFPPVCHGQQAPSSLYVPLRDFAAGHGFAVPVAAADRILVTNRDHTMLFSPRKRRSIIDGVLVYLNGPVEKYDDLWCAARVDISHVILPLLTHSKRHHWRNRPRVVLDPGHGGMDSGAVGQLNATEKKLVLDVARRIRRKLEGSGLAVHLTRDGDSGLSLSTRCAKTWEWRADAFVSIHMNSAANRMASGLETYVLPAPGFPSTAGRTDTDRRALGNRHDGDSIRLARYVHKGVLSLTACEDRGIRRARFSVLCGAPCPAVLVECGFVSNRDEAARLLKDHYRDAIAEGIARGLLTYVSRY